MDNSDLMRVMMLAQRLEPDIASVLEWLHAVPIPRLEGRTAIELIRAGQAERVIALLIDALKREACRSRRSCASALPATQ